MTAVRTFSAACEAVLILRHLRHDPRGCGEKSKFDDQLGCLDVRCLRK